MKVAGIVLGILGVVLLLVGVTAETTAPFSDTLNIGLMQRQVLLVNSGLAALLGGVMLIGFGSVVEVLKPGSEPETAAPSPLSEDDAAFRRRFQIGVGVIAALVVGLIVFGATRDPAQTYDGPSGEYNTMVSMPMSLDSLNVAINEMNMMGVPPSAGESVATPAGEVRAPSQAELEAATLNALDADANAIIEMGE